MPIVTNTSKGDIGLTPDVVVAAGGTLEIDDERLSDLRKGPIVSYYFDEGILVLSGDDAEPKAEENDGLSRDELKAMADDLGIEYAKNIKTDKLAELVEQATA